MERDGKLVALVKFQDNANYKENWQETEKTSIPFTAARNKDAVTLRGTLEINSWKAKATAVAGQAERLPLDGRPVAGLHGGLLHQLPADAEARDARVQEVPHVLRLHAADGAAITPTIVGVVVLVVVVATVVVGLVHLLAQVAVLTCLQERYPAGFLYVECPTLQAFFLGPGGGSFQLVLTESLKTLDVGYVEYVGIALVKIVLGKLDAEFTQAVLNLYETGLCLVIQKGTSLDKTTVVFLQYLYLFYGKVSIIFTVI